MEWECSFIVYIVTIVHYWQTNNHERDRIIILFIFFYIVGIIIILSFILATLTINLN